ncbi:MAG: hypothetical protein LBL47_03860 [Lactobacillus sp.]|jgi:hypothetical protein|nr:hypothetical protein [Lactobacillus sp.]
MRTYKELRVALLNLSVKALYETSIDSLRTEINETQKVSNHFLFLAKGQYKLAEELVFFTKDDEYNHIQSFYEEGIKWHDKALEIAEFMNTEIDGLQSINIAKMFPGVLKGNNLAVGVQLAHLQKFSDFCMDRGIKNLEKNRDVIRDICLPTALVVLDKIIKLKRDEKIQ